jgi:hypothetical protein
MVHNRLPALAISDQTSHHIGITSSSLFYLTIGLLEPKEIHERYEQMR